MDNRRELVKVTIYAVISDIFQWLQTDGHHPVQLRRNFQRKDMKHIFIITDEYDKLRHIDGNSHNFQISAIGNPDRYPIDILEIIYRETNDKRTGGLNLKFSGGEVPVVINPDIAVLDTNGINALINVIVDANVDLINLIEKSGGKYAIKRPRK
jgi:hypothetical protein